MENEAVVAPAPARDRERGLRVWVLALAVSALFVLSAVVFEVLSGANANSPVPAWGEIAPIAWPPAARVIWWTAVAAAAGTFRLALHRLGLRQRPWVVVASVAPFVVFAAGIAAGADWATWH